MAQSNMSFSGLPLSDNTFDKWQEVNFQNLSEQGKKKAESASQNVIFTSTDEKMTILEGNIIGLGQTIQDLQKEKPTFERVESLKMMIKDMQNYEKCKKYSGELSNLSQAIEKIESRILPQAKKLPEVEEQKEEVVKPQVKEDDFSERLLEFQVALSRRGAKQYKNFLIELGIQQEHVSGQSYDPEDIEVAAVITGLVYDIGESITNKDEDNLEELHGKIQYLKKQLGEDYQPTLDIANGCIVKRDFDKLRDLKVEIKGRLTEILNANTQQRIVKQIQSVFPDIVFKKDSSFADQLITALNKFKQLPWRPSVEKYNEQAKKLGAPQLKYDKQVLANLKNILAAIEHRVSLDADLVATTQKEQTRISQLPLQDEVVAYAQEINPQNKESLGIIWQDVSVRSFASSPAVPWQAALLYSNMLLNYYGNDFSKITPEVHDTVTTAFLQSFDDEANVFAANPELAFPEGAWSLYFDAAQYKFMKITKTGAEELKTPEEFINLLSVDNQKNRMNSVRVWAGKNMQQAIDSLSDFYNSAKVDKKVDQEKLQDIYDDVMKVVLTLDGAKQEPGSFVTSQMDTFQKINERVRKFEEFLAHEPEAADIIKEHEQQIGAILPNLTADQQKILKECWKRMLPAAIVHYPDFPWQASLTFSKLLCEVAGWQAQTIEGGLQLYQDTLLESFPSSLKTELDTDDEWEDNPNFFEIYNLPENSWYLDFIDGKFVKVTKTAKETLGNFDSIVALLENKALQASCLTCERLREIHMKQASEG
jgi:hypothetical protein